MKKLSMLFVAMAATMSAWAQQTVASDTKVNTDFSKYKTFAWAKSDPTVVGPNGYEIYYYEITPVQPGEINRDDMNRDMDRNRDQKRNNDTYQKSDRARRDDSYSNKQTETDRTRSDSYGNKPSGYVYSYNVIIPSNVEATNESIREGVESELIGRGYRENESSPDLLVVYQVFDKQAQLHGYNTVDPSGPVGQQVRQPSDTTTFVLEPGTLMISIIDAKTSEMVWNGFSSGLVNTNTSSFMTDDADLREAVHTIFDKFQYTADKARR